MAPGSREKLAGARLHEDGRRARADRAGDRAPPAAGTDEIAPTWFAAQRKSPAKAGLSLQEEPSNVTFTIDNTRLAPQQHSRCDDDHKNALLAGSESVERGAAVFDDAGATPAMGAERATPQSSGLCASRLPGVGHYAKSSFAIKSDLSEG